MLILSSYFINTIFPPCDVRTIVVRALVTGVAITLLSYLPNLLILTSSYSRRKSIRDQVLRDQEAFDKQKRPSPKSEDDDWEQVSSETPSKVATKKTSKSDYDGFIGFFHPFA